jgi:hypothetical protein
MVRAVPATGSRAGPNAAYGPPKTLYNRWKRWSRMGVFATIMTGLAARCQDAGMVMIDVEAGRRDSVPRRGVGAPTLGEVRG